MFPFNKSINVNGGDIDYISFGKGDKYLIIIPGLGDGIKTVRGMYFPYFLKYKKLASEYKIFIFSRRNNISNNFTTDDMALDIVNTMDLLNIKSASILGISQGGMIAQKIAIKYSSRVDKLILVVTTSRVNDIINNRVSKWMEYALNKDYKSIFLDSIKNSYSNKFLSKYFKYCNIISKFGPFKNLDRFIIQARSCLEHNSYDELGKINVSTLIIGASNDNIVGVDASLELFNKIVDSELYIYPDYGHAVYIEAKDFNNRVLEFLNK